VSIDLHLTPRRKRLPGEVLSTPVVYPDLARHKAERLAAISNALGDPIRMQLVDVLRQHAGKVCVCELVPLFEVGQTTLSHHLKKLRQAGIVECERSGIWAFYYVIPEALRELSAWLR
jgi:ArsR family transcriptional regulator